MKQLNKKYTIGCTILVVALLICLTAYWLLYGLIIYAVGSILIVTSNANLKIKIISIVLPFTFYLISLNAYDYSQNSHIKKTFLIPKNFSGEISIVYGLACGQDLKVINGIQIYNIPQNGILFLKSKYEEGEKITSSENMKYFFEDDTINQIPVIFWLQQSDSIKRSVFGGSLTIRNNNKYKDKSNIYSTNFHVFNNDTIKWTNELLDVCKQKQDSILEIEIINCINK